MNAVEAAAALPGWMDVEELAWLAERAATRRVIVELGSWKGRSTKALARATPGTVWAVDHWRGSEDPSDETRKEVERDGPDAVYAAFAANLREEIGAGKVVPVRAASDVAARRLAELLPGGRADMIFIDGEHRYEAVRRDLALLAPLLAKGGLICGHDHDGFWPGVERAVDEAYPSRREGPGSLWYAE